MALAAQKIRTGGTPNMKRFSAKPSLLSRLARWTARGCIVMLVLVTVMEITAIWYSAETVLRTKERNFGCGLTRWGIEVWSHDRAWGEPLTYSVTDSLGFWALPAEPIFCLVKLEYEQNADGTLLFLPFWLLNCVLLTFPIARWLWCWRRRRLAAESP